MAPAADSDRYMGRNFYASVPDAQSGRASPMPLASLSQAHIADALAQSPDGGATLDFSHKNLMDVGEAGAEELAQVGQGRDLADESSVLRIALVGNRLATLPMAFALLSRLRYLTLRSNSFSVFPEVLTIMPSLEILDFSRNKIKRLPSNPGSLVNLRVLSLSRNKLQRLPSYVANFHHLSVLKMSHNPIEWPPKSIMEQSEESDDAEYMQKWLNSVKRWLADNAHKDAAYGEGRRPSEAGSLSRSESSQTDLTFFEGHPASWSRTRSQDDDDYDAGITPHARSFSIDSQISTYSERSFTPTVVAVKPERPPPLHLGFLPPSMPSSLSASPEAYLPTPEDSLTTTDDDAAPALDEAQQARDKMHGRNASYACEGFTGSRKASLLGKKSLPDLRNAKAPPLSQRPLIIRSRGPQTSPKKQPTDEGYAPSPTITQKSAPFAVTVPAQTQPLRLRSNSRPIRPEAGPSSKPIDGPAPSMDNERNSYFRRLSCLPSSSVSNAIPQALLTLVDSVRGILFAVSQVYQTLQHYTVYAIDERLSSVLLKVLDPASTYMSQLITALDRFDSASRRAFPSPAVCRAVVESCRDNVAVFGKAVGVLGLQLKVLATRDDVRYTRQMLLVLYGAMAEISNAWHGMAPHLEAIEPFLRTTRSVPPSSKSSQASSGRLPIQPIAERPEPAPTSAPAAPPSKLHPPPMPILRARSAQATPTTSALTLPQMSRSKSAQVHLPPSPALVAREPKEGRTRMNRRHAGSFSVKDLQIGKALPSNSETMSPTGGVVSGVASTIPTPRSLARHPPQPPASIAPPVPSLSTAAYPPHSLASSTSSSSPQPHIHLHPHPRQESQTSPPGSSIPMQKTNHLEVPSNSNTLVDKEAIEAMDGAVKAAPAVWSMLEEILNDMPDTTVELWESLSRAQTVTSKLRANIKAVEEDHPSADRKALREDAHVFVKTVIQLSSVVKTYGSAHRLSAQLRKDIAKLTNATQEFVMLLHVSSFSPSSTPRPYSPMLSTGGQVAQTSALRQLAEQGGGNGATLSRSRSAQPPASLRVSPSASRAAPRSALPHQTFRIPPPTRMGMALRINEDFIEGHG